MSYIVTIRDNATKEVRESIFPGEWNDEMDNSIFFWTQGNFGCDCNRGLEYRRAGGEDPAVESSECGHGGYSVLKFALPDGRVVKLEE